MIRPLSMSFRPRGRGHVVNLHLTPRAAPGSSLIARAEESPALGRAAWRGTPRHGRKVRLMMICEPCSASLRTTPGESVDSTNPKE